MSEVQDLWVEENYGIGTSLDEEVSPAAKPKESILLSHFHRIVPPIRLAEAYCQDIVTQTRDAHLRLKGQVAERLSNNTKNWLLGTANGSMTLASLRHQVSSSKESNNEASDICPKNESNNCDWPRCLHYVQNKQGPWTTRHSCCWPTKEWLESSTCQIKVWSLYGLVGTATATVWCET